MSVPGNHQPNRIATVGRLVFGPKADIRVNDHERPERVGFCRSLPFGLVRRTVQLCCSAIGGDRPGRKLSEPSKNDFERPVRDLEWSNVTVPET